MWIQPRSHDGIVRVLESTDRHESTYLRPFRPLAGFSCATAAKRDGPGVRYYGAWATLTRKRGVERATRWGWTARGTSWVRCGSIGMTATTWGRPGWLTRKKWEVINWLISALRSSLGNNAQFVLFCIFFASSCGERSIRFSEWNQRIFIHYY